MNKHLIYIVSLFIVVIAAAQTAIADPVTVKLAEGQDPGDPTLSGPPPTTTTTTTTTTTMPIVPRCPDGIAGAKTGSNHGYNYWAFRDLDVCPKLEVSNITTVFCFENPNVQEALPEKANWEMVTKEMNSIQTRLACDGAICQCNGKTCTCDKPTTCTCDGKTCSCNGKTCPTFYGIDPLYYTGTWDDFAAGITARGASHTEACYICRLRPRSRLLPTGGEDHDGGRFAPQHRRRSCR